MFHKPGTTAPGLCDCLRLGLRCTGRLYFLTATIGYLPDIFAFRTHFFRSLSYHSSRTDNVPGRADILFERLIMDSKIRLLVVSVIISVILWLIGGFAFGHTQFSHVFGIVCVFVSIALVGYAAGNLMDTPELPHGKE
ncbi:MAG: hypothetical protein WCA64_08405 [Gallionella sp.]